MTQGRWDQSRNFKMFDHVFTGSNYDKLSREFNVTLATQSSLDKLYWLGQVRIILLVHIFKVFTESYDQILSSTKFSITKKYQCYLLYTKSLCFQYFFATTWDVCTLWQYGLWSFQTGGTKLERFLPIRINIPKGNFWILRTGLLASIACKNQRF